VNNETKLSAATLFALPIVGGFSLTRIMGSEPILTESLRDIAVPDSLGG